MVFYKSSAYLSVILNFKIGKFYHEIYFSKIYVRANFLFYFRQTFL